MNRFQLGTRYCVLSTCTLVAGCARQPAPAELEPVAVVVEAPVAHTPGSPGIDPPAPAKPADPPPPAFPFPDDPAGRALPGVVAPPQATLRAERAAGPTPRTPPARVVEPDPPAKPPLTLPPLPPGAVTSKPPNLPRLPAGFGMWAAVAPPRATLPVPPGVTARGPNVAAVPPPPATAKPAPERPSGDDPAAAAGDALARPAPVVLGVAGFVRVVVPDPFELAEHVRAVPPPAVQPVPVPPRRPR